MPTAQNLTIDASNSVTSTDGIWRSDDLLGTITGATQLTLNGSGFGVGPDVLFSRRFTGDGYIDLAAPWRELGDFSMSGTGNAVDNVNPAHAVFDGRSCMDCTDPLDSGDYYNVFANNFGNIDTLFVHYGFATRNKFPAGIGDVPSDWVGAPSSFKPIWFEDSPTLTADGGVKGADKVFGSHAGSGSRNNGGNSLASRYVGAEYHTNFQFGAWNYTSYEMIPDPLAPDGPNGYFRTTDSNSVTNTVIDEALGENVYLQIPGEDLTPTNRVIPNNHFNVFSIPGWRGGDGQETITTDMLFTNLYISAGPQANSRVELTDNITYANSTKRIVVRPDSWTSTQIKITPIDEEVVGMTYAHIFVNGVWTAAEAI